MDFASAISQHPDYRNAAGEVTGEILEKFGRFGQLAFLFLTPHYINDLPKVTALIDEILTPQVLCGAVAKGVIGINQEVEYGPGISMMMCNFNKVSAIEFSSWDLFTQDIESLINSKLADGFKILPEPNLAIVISTKDFPFNHILELISTKAPNCIITGCVSSYQSDVGSMIFLGNNLISRGAVVILISCSQQISPVVAMGAKAIGPSYTVTKAQDFLVEELAGRRAIDRLILMASESLSPYEIREANSNGLFLATFDEQGSQERCTSLSQVLGTMPSTGAIAVTMPIKVGQTVQFYVRDADFAASEITNALKDKKGQAAIIFSSHLRGTNLFKKPHNDARALLNTIGYKPTSGCFSLAEFIKINDKPSINTLSSTIVLFDDRK